MFMLASYVFLCLGSLNRFGRFLLLLFLLITQFTHILPKYGIHISKCVCMYVLARLNKPINCTH